MQIAIVLYPQYTALDLIGPYEVLHNLPGADVRFVWHQTGPIAADSGVLLIGATHTFDETPSPDLILVPGGPGCFEHARDEALLAWLRTAHTSATWTTSVCTGSIVLGAAGILAGRRATSHWIALPALKTFGADSVGDERIVDAGDGIVTAAGVSAGIDLAMWLAGQIGGESKAKAIQLALEYDPRPPFDSGHISKASTVTKAAATAALTRDSLKPAVLQATTALLWQQSIARVRGRRSRTRRSAA